MSKRIQPAALDRMSWPARPIPPSSAPRAAWRTGPRSIHRAWAFREKLNGADGCPGCAACARGCCAGSPGRVPTHGLMELRRLQRMHDEASGQAPVIVAICDGEQPEGVREIAQEHGLPLTVPPDPHLAVCQQISGCLLANHCLDRRTRAYPKSSLWHHPDSSGTA